MKSLKILRKSLKKHQIDQKNFEKKPVKSTKKSLKTIKINQKCWKNPEKA